MVSNIIEVHNITKEFKVLNHHEGLMGSIKDLFSRDYRIVEAVSDISMSITQGEIVGYLGPNGAGKSTTIKMLSGILEPSSGEILVNGIVPHKNRIQNAQDIGVVFGQRSQLWWSLPLIESFKILKDIYQIGNDEYNDMIELYDKLLHIDDLWNKPVRQMSLGQRTLSDILAAFLHNPKVVFLDEPTIGLDVSMKSKIRGLIKALNQEKNTTIILTTHDMGDVEALCNRIVIIDRGKKIFDDKTNKLKEHFSSYRTMSLNMEQEYNKEELVQKVNKKFKLDSNSIICDEKNVKIVVDESKVRLLDVFNEIQYEYKIGDVKIEEISVEEIVKNIYEGGL